MALCQPNEIDYEQSWIKQKERIKINNIRNTSGWYNSETAADTTLNVVLYKYYSINIKFYIYII